MCECSQETQRDCEPMAVPSFTCIGKANRFLIGAPAEGLGVLSDYHATGRHPTWRIKSSAEEQATELLSELRRLIAGVVGPAAGFKPATPLLARVLR